MQRQARLGIVIVVLVVLLAGGAAWLFLRDAGHTIRLSEAEIQLRLGERLPRSWAYADRFELMLDNPRVRLREDSNRIEVGFDVALSLRVTGRQIGYRASADASSGIRYAATDASFYLSDPLIESLTLPGIAERHRERVRAALDSAITEHYARRPVYTLRDGDLRQRAARIVLKEVSVEQRQLVVRLGF